MSIRNEMKRQIETFIERQDELIDIIGREGFGFIDDPLNDLIRLPFFQEGSLTEILRSLIASHELFIVDDGKKTAPVDGQGSACSASGALAKTNRG